MTIETSSQVDPKVAVAAANNMVWTARTYGTSPAYAEAMQKYAYLLANNPKALQALQELQGWES